MVRAVRFILPRAFLKAADGVFGPRHLDAIKAKLALNPELGDRVPGTGGARKLRQYGIRGQARVIYYFHAGNDEIFMLTCYPKNRQSDLTTSEKRALRETIALIESARML
jgi:hypothetical protein